MKMDVRGIDTTTRRILRQKGQRAQGSSVQMLTYAICSTMIATLCEALGDQNSSQLGPTVYFERIRHKPQSSASCLYPRNDVQPCQGLPREMRTANAMQAF